VSGATSDATPRQAFERVGSAFKASIDTSEAALERRRREAEYAARRARSTSYDSAQSTPGFGKRLGAPPGGRRIVV
jgi:hypothetical protein